MILDFVTKTDLEAWKQEVITEVSNLIKGNTPKKEKWAKSKRAREILECSPGTLQNLRQNGTLIFTKIGGTLYYDMDSINQVLETNKQNAS